MDELFRCLVCRKDYLLGNYCEHSAEEWAEYRKHESEPEQPQQPAPGRKT